jgi:hypothetical protein
VSSPVDKQTWQVNESLPSLANISTHQKPVNRKFHIAAVYQDNMFIHGGVIDFEGITNELWKFSHEELMWQKLDDEKSPQLSYHSAVVHQKAVWIHGGTPRSGISSNTWRLSFDTMKWECVCSQCCGPALFSHTASNVGRHMIIIGGKTRTDWNYDIWLFHFGTHNWSSFQGNIPPLPLMDHTVVSLRKDENYYIRDRRIGKGTVSAQTKSVGSDDDVSTVSLNDCGVEMDNLAASVSLPGSVSVFQVGDDIQTSQVETVALGLEKETATGHRNSSESGDVGSPVTFRRRVDLYLLGGKTDWHGTSSEQLSMWHCYVGKKNS